MISPDRFKSMASGRSKGVIPTLTRGILSAVSLPWAGLVATRNMLYDHRLLKIETLDIPVLSVGNLTLGGTGKTPVVAWLARALMERGARPGIVSRGYKAPKRSLRTEFDRSRSTDPLGRQYNDEARELDILLERQVPQCLHPVRIRAAKALLRSWPDRNVLILDDAFQHRRIGRSLDLVLLDALDPFGFDHLFPRGMLRESVQSLKRADIVLLSRADLITESQTEAIRSRIFNTAPNVVFGRIAHRPIFMRQTGREPLPFTLWKEQHCPGERLFAFCGIGNPEGFFQLMTNEGFAPVGRRVFPDHSPYTEKTLLQTAEDATVSGATGIITTLKDHVKIDRSCLGNLPLWALEIGIDFLEGEEKFIEKIESVLTE